jgi:HPt (histidine-containing phosphotransfer) domain-containing protein
VERSLDSSPAAPAERASAISLPPALDRLGNDILLLRELAGFYLEDVPPLLGQMEHDLAGGNAAAVAHAAHSIKGLSANFDAVEAVEVAQAIERSGGQRDLGEIRQRLPALRKAVERVIKALREEVLADRE